MVAIRTFTQLLPKKHDDPNFKDRYMSIVEPQIDRIQELCDALHQLGDPKTIKKETILLSSLINPIQDLLNTSKTTRKPLIKLHNCHIDIHVDPKQFEQVIMNLMLNAFDAVEDKKDGLISISTSISEKNMLKIDIQDNGCGIEKDKLPHLFDPFYTTKVTGTGLGMTIVHQIVKQHNGHIDVKSELNSGTCFTLHLPLTNK